MPDVRSQRASLRCLRNLLVLFVANAGLLDFPVFRATFTGQVVFYGVAGLEWAFPRRLVRSLLTLPLYFGLLNAAAGVFMNFLRGERVVTWSPH